MLARSHDIIKADMYDGTYIEAPTNIKLPLYSGTKWIFRGNTPLWCELRLFLNEPVFGGK